MTYKEQIEIIKMLVNCKICWVYIFAKVDEGVVEFDYKNTFSLFGHVPEEKDLRHALEDKEFEEMKEDGDYEFKCFLSYCEEQRSFPEHVDFPAHYEIEEYEILKFDTEPEKDLNLPSIKDDQRLLKKIEDDLPF